MQLALTYPRVRVAGPVRVKKAFTLWQPWAQGVALGLKRYETRSWQTSFRGFLAIHAAARPVSPEHQELMEKYGITEVPLSGFLAVVELVDCIRMTEEFIARQSPQEIEWGDWQPGRWAWKFENLMRLETPIAAKGYQQIWNIDQNVEIYFEE